MSAAVWSEQDLRDLGAVTDITTAGAILQIGETTARKMARDGTFPVPVLRLGAQYRVPVRPLLDLLGLGTP